MITILVGIQSVCVGITSFVTYRTLKQIKEQKIVKVQNYKHKKVGGF